MFRFRTLRTFILPSPQFGISSPLTHKQFSFFSSPICSKLLLSPYPTPVTYSPSLLKSTIASPVFRFPNQCSKNFYQTNSDSDQQQKKQKQNENNKEEEEEDWENFETIDTDTSYHQKIIGSWLLFMAGLVGSIVVVGGLTRLTESGLSIVDWRPVTGLIPPLSSSEWEKEFSKYKDSPEFKILRLGKMTVDEFKRIFYWEWAHRNLGRLIGLAYVFPFLYFFKKGWLSKRTKKVVSVLIGLVGFQGFIGWWMVKSGLQTPKTDPQLSVSSSPPQHTPPEIPRVSQYRLATHLSIALIILSLTLSHSLSLLTPLSATPYNSSSSSQSILSSKIQSIYKSTMYLASKTPNYNQALLLKKWSHFSVMMVFFTSIAGAFVAGLDAGLIYNEFPWMGYRRLVPEEYLSMKPIQKNFFENSATVQFNHRLLATLTLTNILAMGVYGKAKVPLTPSASRLLTSIMVMGGIQFSLGIATLLTFVPIHLAGCHQLGSIVLLSLSIGLMNNMKRKPLIITKKLLK